MSPRSVRRIVIAVCVAGIGGMIASSIADNNGAALTTGIITAVAVLCLIVATAVTGGGRGDPTRRAETSAPGPEFEHLAAEVEAGVQRLVESGAEEDQVRRVVGDAVRLGRCRE